MRVGFVAFGGGATWGATVVAMDHAGAGGRAQVDGATVPRSRRTR